MGKDKHANDIEDTLREVGWTTRSEKSKRTKNGYTSGEREGEPDILAIRHGVGIFIEAKTFKAAFTISKYSDEQIKWALDAQNRSEHMWVWFFGGGDPPNYDHTKTNKDGKPYQPRKAWLMPFMVMYKTFQIYEGRQKSIPYGNQLRMNAFIRDNELHFLGQFKRYEMTYETGNKWTFCWEHPFRVQFMPNEPFPLKHEHRFNAHDKVRISGYSSVYKVLRLDHYNWNADCWEYTVYDASNDMEFGSVSEDTMYLAGE
jgi:hypothetical protein